MWRRLARRVSHSIAPDSTSDDIAEELRLHIARDIERHIASGMTTAEATARAHREFGNIPALQQSASDATQVATLHDTMRGLRLAARALTRRAGFASTAILSLALGLAAATTVFSVVNALVLRPLPYRDPAALVAIGSNWFGSNQQISYLRQHSRTLQEVIGFSPGWLMPLTGVATARELDAAKVTGNFFSTLGVRPLIGRPFDIAAETPGNDHVAVLGEALWTSAFGRDPAIVGRSITLDGQPYTVLAVMPRTFRLLDADADLWVPMAMDPTASAWQGGTSLILGKMRATATVVTTNADMRTQYALMNKAFQVTGAAPAPVVSSLQAAITGSAASVLTLVAAAVGILLLIAIVNVVNLLIVRTAERAPELAIRTSLGATPFQLTMLLLHEGMLLSLGGGLLGLLGCAGGVALLRNVLPASTPRLQELSVDWRAFALLLAFVLLIGLVFTVIPGRVLRKRELAQTMRIGRSVVASGARTRGALIALEFALALVLTTGAVLMGRTLVALNHVDRGIKSDGLLTAKLMPSLRSDTARRSYWHTLLDAVQAVPGVQSAATMLHMPMSGRTWRANVVIEGQPVDSNATPLRTAWQSVSPQFLTTTGLRLIAGRDFASSDGPDAPIAMLVNRSFARTVFPGVDAVGKRIQAGFATGKNWATIIGVVADMPHDSLNGVTGAEVYVSMEQRMVGATSLLVRAAGQPQAIAASVRRAIEQVDRNVPIDDMRTMDDRYTQSLLRSRLLLTLLVFFAASGLLLGSIGIYGIVAYGVRQRRREIGIRAALGAGRGELQWTFVREAAQVAAIGIIAGVPIAVAGATAMRALLYGVAPSDPRMLVASIAVLFAIALLASWVPSRAATRVPPASALRGE